MNDATASSLSEWGFEHQLTSCPRCGWSYLIPAGLTASADSLRCPHCFQAELDQLSGDPAVAVENLPRLAPPELLVPHSLPQEKLVSQVQAFASGIPFAPTDFTASNLVGRLQRVFLPVWLAAAALVSPGLLLCLIGLLTALIGGVGVAIGGFGFILLVIGVAISIIIIRQAMVLDDI